MLRTRELAFTFFDQNNDFFKIKDFGIVEVNALCGSRTLHQLARSSDLVTVTKFDTNPKVSIVRDDRLRMVSAYNKKVKAVNTDWRKRLLLYANDLDADFSFIQFLNTLIQRKINGLKIDKHFRPCRGDGEIFLRLDQFGSYINVPFVEEYLVRNKFQSSEQLLGKSSLKYSALSVKEKDTLESYLRLFS